MSHVEAPGGDHRSVGRRNYEGVIESAPSPLCPTCVAGSIVNRSRWSQQGCSGSWRGTRLAARPETNARDVTPSASPFGCNRQRRVETCRLSPTRAPGPSTADASASRAGAHLFRRTTDVTGNHRYGPRRGPALPTKPGNSSGSAAPHCRRRRAATRTSATSGTRVRRERGLPPASRRQTQRPAERLQALAENARGLSRPP